ncbi:DNA-3-methyladenine glycosylase I [Frateuria sp. MAH-13]|uniref:DNA-3-methyladenine glycosylase I n=1 Tax=Frateuria flava TaxID=2821489 RepID=A0ABS4DQ47_9GAMM|nr:DNA-3-methyladenine glycosylase I [Frateuria flava]MBP1475182.1 DNA-3-methyladenine glycosylase I [Frateuria flava]
MTLPVVEGWNPLGGRPARSDDEIFELLTAAVFQARFRPAVVRARWPAIRQAFAGFALAAVAAWPDACLDELLAAEGMIRNPKKIRASLRNARDLQARSRQFGSVAAYLQSLGDDPEARVSDIDTWAHYIGAPSIRWFVRALAGGGAE